ncbi:STAS domain-containing protein [Amycolatopsis kentuckyensis]|uniref:STAS domain-containing protein n=1 Tax=Amycolatopsis kentuckyensis TaxID=218823 RepID=UPI000A35E23E|nr:STAS domain-containing protein [Amycolatopsis kentuckyensis]
MPSADASRPGRLTVSRSHGDPAVVALDGELDSETVLLMARAIAQSVAREPVPEVVVLDLAGVTALTPAGLRVLPHARDHVARCGSTLRITTPSDPGTRHALRSSPPYATFDVYADLRAALDAGDRRSFLELVHRLWTAGD